jgi:hypothetical protein
VDEEAEAGVPEDLRLGRIVRKANGVFGEEWDRRPGRGGRLRGGAGTAGRSDERGGRDDGEDGAAETRGHREHHGGLLRPSLLMEQGPKIKYYAGQKIDVFRLLYRPASTRGAAKM